MESIIDYLKRRLREVGASKWPAVAECTGVAPSFLPKLVYGTRENPHVATIQPLLDFFHRVDSGSIDVDALRSAPNARGSYSTKTLARSR